VIQIPPTHAVDFIVFKHVHERDAIVTALFDATRTKSTVSGSGDHDRTRVPA